jgi:circadian clock protein KaiB
VSEGLEPDGKRRGQEDTTWEALVDTPSQDERYVMCLYVNGSSERSRAAIAALEALCTDHLQGRCDLEVVDLSRHPHLASSDQIFAMPTLVKKLPQPARRLIGNLADEQKVLLTLDLRPRP